MLNRRRFLQAAALSAAATATTGAFAPANAQRRILGTVIDYSAGVPSAAAVKAAGHMGAVRYVSQRRPGANWMVGKPVTIEETRDFAANGLATASVYQFGRAETADWLAGAAGAAKHAPQAIQLHRAAGGPTGRPIYVAIDDNPTRDQYVNQIRPYLQAFQLALSAAGLRTGVYGNYNVIQWCVEDRIGTFFWQPIGARKADSTHAPISTRRRSTWATCRACRSTSTMCTPRTGGSGPQGDRAGCRFPTSTHSSKARASCRRLWIGVVTCRRGGVEKRKSARVIS